MKLGAPQCAVKVTRSMVYKGHSEIETIPRLGSVSYFLIVKFHKNAKLCKVSLLNHTECSCEICGMNAAAAAACLEVNYASVR